MNSCPHCHSGHDPVLVQSTWSCGVRCNDPSWRTKECYKRNLELADERIKRLEEAGDATANLLLKGDLNDHTALLHTYSIWTKAKEAKP